MEYAIRDIAPGETGLLREFLYQAIFVPDGEAPPDRSILDKPELRVYVDGFGARAGDTCVVAEASGAVVGAAWARVMDDYGHVDDDTPSIAIAVFPEWRGRGVGTALLTGLLDRVRRQGYGRVSLSVQTANRAIRLYRRLGFTTLRAHDGEAIMLRAL